MLAEYMFIELEKRKKKKKGGEHLSKSFFTILYIDIYIGKKLYYLGENRLCSDTYSIIFFFSQPTVAMHSLSFVLPFMHSLIVLQSDDPISALPQTNKFVRACIYASKVLHAGKG